MSFDRNDPDDLLALKTEVNTDPNAYGYDPETTQAGVLDIINLPRAEFVFSKDKVAAAQIRTATTYDAYNNLVIDEQEWIRWVTGSNGFDDETTIVTDDFKVQFTGNTLAQTGAGNETNSFWATANRTEMTAAMRLIFERPGSRAEDLFGLGTIITRDDWFAARDS